ncbi:MAG: hypothetical protein JNM38_15310 [Acidobacteria bacterium]|jgi:hypothetical protein|nr:hypothetical protein [Acidobacteriota bacterium]
MSLARLGLSVAGVAAVIAVTLAAAIVWLLLTDPVTVADAMNDGEVTPFVRAVAGVLYGALRGVLKYL